MSALTPGARQPAPTCTATRHGTATAYVNDGCRCPLARADRTRQNKMRRSAGRTFTDGTGTRRRLEALMWMGWSARHIGSHIGWSRGSVGSLLAKLQHGRSVERNTAARIAATYERLSMTPGPSRIAHGKAASANYRPPLAWDNIDDPAERPQLDPLPAQAADIDTVLVDRAVAGQSRASQLTQAERWEAVRILHGFGYTDRQMAARLHCNIRIPCRDRKRLGLPANADHGRREAG
jgi:hypothetical protein